MSATGASFNRGSSKQDYETPPDLMAAVVARFGPFAWDLAATRENAKAPNWLGPGSPHWQDSLIAPWQCLPGLKWLNQILLLIPASVGSNYWADFVDGTAIVNFLRPRVQFAGADGPFPKDIALCGYGLGIAGYTCWKWK